MSVALEVELGARLKYSWITLNCANLPDQLVRSRAFWILQRALLLEHTKIMWGYSKRPTGGVLFLDEIGDIPLTVQNRLLKAIEEKQIKRLGTNRYIFCDVQIIAPISRNLPLMIQHGEFREGLYGRTTSPLVGT